MNELVIRRTEWGVGFVAQLRSPSVTTTLGCTETHNNSEPRQKHSKAV